MSYKTCPEWPELMELAPDLQFKHISVADAQLPFDVLSKISHVSLGEVEICCDLDHHVFNAAHTDPAGRGGARRARTGSRCTSGPRPGPAPRSTPPEHAALGRLARGRRAAIRRLSA